MRLIRAYAESTAKPSIVYNLAQIPPPASPSPAPPPAQPTDLTVTLGSSDGALTLRWKASNPTGTSGTSYIIRRKLPSETQFQFTRVSGKKEFVDDTLIAGPDSVQYTVQGQRADSSGPLSSIFAVNFGRLPGRGLTASVMANAQPVAYEASPSTVDGQVVQKTLPNGYGRPVGGWVQHAVVQLRVRGSGVLTELPLTALLLIIPGLSHCSVVRYHVGMAKRTTKAEHGLATGWASQIGQSVVKLRGGVVGRLAGIAIAAVVGLSVITYFQPSVAGIAVWLLPIVVLLIAAGILWYAHQHPDTSLLEGAEVLQHKQLELATKSGPVPTAMLDPSTDLTVPEIDSSDSAMLPDATSEPKALPGGSASG